MRTFVFLFGGGMVGLAGALCFLVIRHGFILNAVVWAILGATGFSAAFSLIFSPMMHFFFFAALSQQGIYGHSFWGFRRFVSWQDITRAQVFRLINLPWLRIYGTDGKVTWVALFQSRPDEFREEIQKFAPPGNPVLKIVTT